MTLQRWFGLGSMPLWAEREADRLYYWYEDVLNITICQVMALGGLWCAWEGRPDEDDGKHRLLWHCTFSTPEEALAACVAPSVTVEAS